MRSTMPLLTSSSGDLADRGHQIIDAAYALLDEKGLEGLTIRAVLARTGLSRRAFYERFGGKDDLILAVFEQTIRVAARHYTERADAVDDPIERLRVIVTGIVFGRSEIDGGGAGSAGRLGAAMSREHLRLADARPRELEAALGPLLDLIAHQLADGMAAGVIRKAEPRRLAKLTYNLVSTTIHAELLIEEGAPPDREQRARLAAEIWNFCRGAISA
jgi:AcrR family transcriptional regulator